MRITMGMISKQYSASLNKTLSSLNDAGECATDYRKYDRASEDPYSAAKAYRLRREYQQNLDFQSNVSNITSMLDTAESSLMTVNEIVQEAGASDVIEAITGTMSLEDRSTIATKLRTMQEAIVAAMNTELGDQYLFSGSGTAEPPFTVDDSGNLLYRGINVDTGENSNGATTDVNGTQICFGASNGDTFNGYTLTIETGAAAGSGVAGISVSGTNISITLCSGGATNSDLQSALQNDLDDAFSAASISTSGYTFSDITVLGNADAAVPGSEVVSGTAQQSSISNIVDLETLADEKIYIDLGLGLKINSDGSVQSQSAFNVSMPGISYLGYGETEDGIPNNLYSLLGEIADQLESDDFSIDTIRPYLENFEESGQVLLNGITDIGARSNSLEYTQSRLEDKEDSLLTKIDEVEYVDSTDAIMNYKMAEYAYTAALQIGTSILQPTFLDFMD